MNGIELLAPEKLTASEQPQAEPVLAMLYLVRGTVEQGQRRWTQSRESLDEARARLESLVKAQPAKSAAHQQSLAAVYRHLGETSAQLGDLPRQVQFSELALDLQRQLIKQYPDQADYQLGLALACINCSTHRETAGQITAAIEELNEGLEVTDRLSTRFPQVARYRYTLAGLHARRGNLEWIQERVPAAETDLVRAIKLMRDLVHNFPDVPDYREGLMQARLSLAEIKIQRNRVPAAARIFSELFTDGKKLTAEFPEVAARSMTIGIASVQFNPVQLRGGHAADTIRTLEQAMARFEELGKSDDSANPRWWQAKTAMQLGRSRRALEQTAEALADFERAAEILTKLADQHPEDFDLLSRLATTHNELSADFNATAKSYKAASLHRKREIDLRVRVVNGAPNNPYFRVLYARSLKEHGDVFRAARDLRAAEDLFGKAAAVLAETIANFPDDRLVRLTMGDLRASEGRVLFLRSDFAGAEIKFAEAVNLNPSLANRSSRANNLSRFRPEQVLEQVDAVLADRIPDTMPLKSLLIACGTAANNLSDQNMQTAIGDRVVTILTHMVDDDYLPHPDTIKLLQSGETFSVFQKRDDYNRLVNTLHERNLVQQGPSFLRYLPEQLQPAGRWLIGRSVKDLSPTKWNWKILEDWLNQPK
jgi:tetratricopeptide (TPR) repeat protein